MTRNPKNLHVTSRVRLIILTALALLSGLNACRNGSQNPDPATSDVSSRPLVKSVRGYVPEITNFKARAAQLETLKANEKCTVESNTVLQFKSAPIIAADHIKVELTHPLKGCSFTKGFFYIAHLKTDAYMMTITADTFLKASPVAQSALSQTDKCFVSPSLVPVSTTPSGARGSHYFIKLEKNLPGCARKEGFVYADHMALGIQAITISEPTQLKKSEKSTSQLSNAEKCSLPVATYPLSAPIINSEKGHYRIEFPKAIIGCPFQAGYVYAQHTTDFEPNAGVPKYTYPVPSGYSTSQWCVCRSIGTSPHIGQDFVNNDSVIHSVAVKRGTISSVQYNGSCGYEVQLRDETGAIWRYLHLNPPRSSLTVGSKVEAGTLIGYHSTYPTEGCGLGAHLHMERLTAGGFKDSPGGANCNNRFGSCNYDPYKPWRNQGLGLADGDISIDGKILELDPIEKVTGKTCRETKNDGLDESTLKAEIGATIKNTDALTVDSTLQTIDGHKVLVSAAKLSANPENNCNNGNDCLVQWRVYAKAADGKLKKIVQDQSIRNTSAQIMLEHMYCIEPSSTPNLIVVAKTSSGKWVQKEVKLTETVSK